MSVYTVFGVEEVYDAFDEYEHANPHAPFSVEADSVDEAVERGTRDLRQWIEYEREGFWASGWFVPRIILVADDNGDLVLDARGSLIRDWPFKSDDRGVIPPGQLPTRICFLSYNHLDELFAARLYRGLLRQNFICWYAPERPEMPGHGRVERDQVLRQRIASGISAAHIVIVVVSETALASAWVEFEVSSAIEGRRLNGRPSVIGLALSRVGTRTEWLIQIETDGPLRDFSQWQDDAWFDLAVRAFASELDAIYARYSTLRRLS